MMQALDVSLGAFAIHGVRVERVERVERADREQDRNVVTYTVTLHVNDIEKPWRRTEIRSSFRISRLELGMAQHGGDLFKHVVRSAVRSAVLHEVDEWLRIDGALATDPHLKGPTP